MALDGLVTMVARFLRKSMYAVGGVIGVFNPSSCLIESGVADRGLFCSSDGNDADLGVLSGWRLGLSVAMMG